MNSFDSEHQAKLEKAKAKTLEKHPNLDGLYVFGSFGSKYENLNSDLDLAILTQESLDQVAL